MTFSKNPVWCQTDIFLLGKVIYNLKNYGCGLIRPITNISAAQIVPEAFWISKSLFLLLTLLARCHLEVAAKTKSGRTCLTPSYPLDTKAMPKDNSYQGLTGWAFLPPQISWVSSLAICFSDSLNIPGLVRLHSSSICLPLLDHSSLNLPSLSCGSFRSRLLYHPLGSQTLTVCKA